MAHPALSPQGGKRVGSGAGSGGPFARHALDLRPRGWPSLLAGAIALALVLGMAFDSGGYFPPTYLAAGAIAFVVLAALLILRPPFYSISTPALVGLAGLAGLTAWTLVSAGWSAAPAAGVEAAQRDVAYLGLFGLALIAAGSGRYAGLLAWGVLAAIVVVGVAGLISRLYPDVIAGPSLGVDVYRLSYPLSYWNAYGALCAMGMVLAIGLAADRGTPVVLRGLSTGASILLAVGVYFSLSRGSWLAALVALALLVATGPRRGAVLLNAAVVAGAAALAILRLRHFPGLVTDPRAGLGQLHEGHVFGPELVVLSAAGSLVGGGVSAVEESPRKRLGGIDDGRATRTALAVVCSALALGLVAVEFGPVGDFVDRQWTDFLRPAATTQVGSARLLDLKGTRSDVYRVAIDGFAANPVIGAGAGSFQSQWFRSRRVDQQLVNAHSLELETLDELGLVGGLLLIVFLGSAIASAVRARRTTGALGSAKAAAVTAALSVWLIHSGVDWDWQISAETGLAILLAATLYPFGRVRLRRGAGI